jgi:hypothetical protein
VTLLLDDPQADVAPHGTSAGWDSELIALLALLTAADLALADSLWDTLTPAHWRGLLLATAVDDARELVPLPRGFWFDRHSQRYGLDLRGAIPQTAIRTAFAGVVTAAALRMSTDARAMAIGRVDVTTWQNSAAALVKALAVLSAALGKGGIQELTPDDQTAVSESLEFHFTKLERFAGQVAAGVLLPERVGRRAAQYPVAAALLYPQMRRIGHELVGYKSERRILHPAEHCADCPPLAEMGWVPIGTLPDIGTGTRCSFMCLCSFEWRRD